MTPTQQKVLDGFRLLRADAQIEPTVRELAGNVDLTVSGTHKALQALVKAGYLTHRPGLARSYNLAGAPDLRSVGTDALRDELARRGVTLEAMAIAEPHSRGRGRGRTCAADICGTSVAPGMLFCRPHWFRLPRDLQDEIKRAFGRRDVDLYQQLVAEARDYIETGRRWGRAA